jgi:hypothetical protein
VKKVVFGLVVSSVLVIVAPDWRVTITRRVTHPPALSVAWSGEFCVPPETPAIESSVSNCGH